MSTRRRFALLLASAAALGVGLIALSASAAAAPPVVPSCTPKPSSDSDSCVKGTITAVNPPLGTALEPIRLGTRVRSVFSPVSDETTKVTIRYDDDGAINLSGIPTCPGSELAGMNIAQAYEQCGPGADGNPPSEGNAYLSPAGNVSGIASTVPPGNLTACTMLFKGADNNHVTLYARAPVVNATTGCNNPAANTAGNVTVIFTGTLSRQPASSPYDWTLTVPNTDAANPALDDFYATVSRGNVFRAKCPAGASPLKIQAVFDYTTTATDTVGPPYAGTTQTCP